MTTEHTTTAITTLAPSPMPGSASGARPSPRFYLVGEAERSTRRRPVSAQGRTAIAINGRWHELRGTTATFEQLLRIAFPGQALANPGLATVTFRHGAAAAPEGILTPGDAIPLADGLVINANATYAS